MSTSKQTMDLLHQCDDWSGDWMSHWICEEAGELLFYAPDNELLVCVPIPETLGDAVQFLNALQLKSTYWAQEQDESQPTPFNPE